MIVAEERLNLRFWKKLDVTMYRLSSKFMAKDPIIQSQALCAFHPEFDDSSFPPPSK